MCYSPATSFHLWSYGVLLMYHWKETHNIFYDPTHLEGGKSFSPTKHERPEVSCPSYPLPYSSLAVFKRVQYMWTIMVLQVKLYHAPGQQTVQVWPALFLKHCLKHFLMLTKERLQVVEHFVANPPARLTSVLKVSMSTFSFIVLNVIYYCRHCEWWKYNNYKRVK